MTVVLTLPIALRIFKHNGSNTGCLKFPTELVSIQRDPLSDWKTD